MTSVLLSATFAVAAAVVTRTEPLATTGVVVSSDFGEASGSGDVLVLERPNLSARVYRTSYGTTVVFENGSLHGPQAVDRSGHYRIVIGGKTVFDGPMTLLPYGRSKHGPFRTDGSPTVVPQMTDEVRRRARLNIGIGVPESVLATLPLSFPKKIVVVPGSPSAVGTVPAYMATTGANPNIGIVPAHAARALASGDRRAIVNTLAEADAFFTWPVHFRDEKSGRPLVYTDHPYASIASSDRGDLIRNSAQNVFQPDAAHQPHPLFLAYLLTGEPYYLEEMLLWDSFNYMLSPDSVRLGSMSLIRTDSGLQARGAAWVLVARGQLLSVLPKDHPSYPAIVASLEANARVYKERFIDGTFDESKLQYSPYRVGGAKNDLGLFSSDAVYGVAPDGSVLTAGWMNAFVVQAWAYLHALDLPLSAQGRADLEAVMRFGFRFEQRLGPKGGWDVRRMGTYNFPAGHIVDGQFRWYADHQETYRHQTARLQPLPADSRTMVSHDSNVPIEYFGSFEGNEWPAIAFAKMYGDDGGAFDAVVATDSFKRLATGFDPQWAIFPPGMSVASILKGAAATAK